MLIPRKAISFLLCFLLILEQSVFAQSLDLSRYFVHNPSQAISQSDKFRPLHLRYLGYDNLSQDFKILLDKGDTKKEDLENKAYIEKNTQTLLKYFLIGLSLPNEKFWVNLRPDSPDNIIDPDLERTDIGRIFLEADLQLKKDTAQWTSPQTKEGKVYWDKLYKKAEELFGTENLTIPTLTRPWIVPNEIIIRESPDDAYIYKATLKVMLEEDYLSSRGGSRTAPTPDQYTFSDPRLKELNQYSTELIKENIIPKLTYEVNTSKRYAPLRQVYYSLILAQWFKQRFGKPVSQLAGKPVNPLTGKPANPYSKLIDSRDLTNLTSKEPYDKQTYFRQYQKSFKDGEYNLSEPVYTPFGQSIRRYVSGGIKGIVLIMPEFGAETLVDLKTGTKITSSPVKTGISDIFRKEKKWLISLLLSGVLTININSVDPVVIPPAIKTALVHAAPSPRDLSKYLNELTISTIIDEGGGPKLLGLIEELKTLPVGNSYLVIATMLQHPKLGKEERGLIVKTLLEYVYSRSDKAVMILLGILFSIDIEIAQLIIAEGGIPKLIKLAQDMDYDYHFKVLELLCRLLILSPNDIERKDSESIILLIQDALNGDYYLEAHMMLTEIIGVQPRYGDIIAKQISDKRERVKVLPESRASKEIVLVVADSYNEGHGFAVLSTILTGLGDMPVDLNNRESLDKIGKKEGVKQPNENVGEIAKRLFRTYGISLIMIGVEENLEELQSIIKAHKDKTIIVSMSSMGNIYGGFISIVDPRKINGIIDPSLVSGSGAKEILFIVGAGNKGLPRLYTHPIFDNVIPIGAAQRDKNGVWKKSPFSDYGNDIFGYTEGLSVDGTQQGTSFAAPKVAAILTELLIKNPNMSIKEALKSLRKQEVPLDGSHLGGGVMIIGGGKRGATQEYFESEGGVPVNNVGGIDFTRLPIVTQAITNLGSSPLTPSSYLSLRQLNLSEEYQAIESLASSGITPSPERLKSFLQASCLQDNIGEDKDKALSLLSELLRQQEFSLQPTQPGLRDILVVLELATSPQQLKEIFLGKIN